LSAYGYIYNVTAESVAQEASVSFSNNGPLVGITHTAGTAGVTVTSAGTYSINFSVTGTPANQFALFLNGTVVPQSLYGAAGGNSQNDGQVILALAAGDVLTLVNHTSHASSVSLDNSAGGTQTNVDASLLIEKLA
jgi:hypothetical protein